MASNQKFNKQAVYNQLKHVSRELKYPKNIDIDTYIYLVMISCEAFFFYCYAKLIL